MVGSARPVGDQLWRLGKREDPLAASPILTAVERAHPRGGNRFDSSQGNYRVIYFGSNIETCLGETLARLRPDPSLIAVVRDEWQGLGFMEVGTVAAKWRADRIAVLASIDLQYFRNPSEAFVDAEDVATHQVLRQELAKTLAQLGYADLDVGVVRGPDRRVTRAISQWAYEQTDDDGNARYAGVRYISRLNDAWECWAVFEDVPVYERETKAIELELPELDRVAKEFGLRVF